MRKPPQDDAIIDESEKRKPVETKRTLAMCYPLNLNSPCRVFAPCDRKFWRLCREQYPPQFRRQTEVQLLENTTMASATSVTELHRIAGPAWSLTFA